MFGFERMLPYKKLVMVLFAHELPILSKKIELELAKGIIMPGNHPNKDQLFGNGKKKMAWSILPPIQTYPLFLNLVLCKFHP